MEASFGRYRLLERLGEGGMAEVFKAKSFGVEGFEKVLVIKRILPKLASHPSFVDMFVHEAKLSVRLSHANIVQVFDLGRVDHAAGEPASYFIAMEYVPGLDLATLLARCRRQKAQIPFGMAVFLCAEVAKALDHAHRRRDEHGRPLGIVHRDISPQNILLSWEGEVKVTDFGIAKAKDSIADEEAGDGRERVRGKLAYMSPEQSRAEALDGRSDLFSLGAVFYEMVSGTNPFVATTAFETLRRVQAAEYPPLELLRPDATNALAEIVGKLLAKDRDERVADAGRLHEHLLGYFYATGDRFGPSKLSEFLEQFHDTSPQPEIETGAVFEEQSGANERTPVEAPNANPQTGAIRLTTTGLFRTTGELGHVTRTTVIGERREVTALVVSFVGGDRSRDARDGLPELGAPAREVLARYGAKVLEEDASQIVALFGLGDADGRDTDAAVRAALVLVRAGGGALASAGIHVAKIVVDAQGEPIADERLASLIASAQALARATDGQVAVSSVAARIVRVEFATAALPNDERSAVEIEADRAATPGKSSPPKSAVAPRLRPPEGARVVTSAWSPSSVYGRFVGRQDELRRLGDILAHGTRRRVQLVTLQGDKGLGKTRMIAEMERRLGKGNYNVGFYVAACPRNGADAKYSALSAMLRVLCGIQEGDGQARILDVLPRLRALGLHSDESSAVLAALGATSGEGVARPPEDRSAVLRAAFGRMVQSLCDDRLHCFCWDDAQSMDAATLEAILAVAGRTSSRSLPPPSSGAAISSAPGPVSSGVGGLRAVFLFATRNDPPDALATSSLHHRVILGELSDDDSARLISTRIGTRVLAPEVLAFCRARAGGHPLFLEELVKELLDSGAVSVVNGEAKAKLEQATNVPHTLRTLIASRVSRLDPAERTTLQAAAILGDPILTPVLASLLKQSVAEADRGIATLLGRGFLRMSGPGQACFASPMHGEIVLDAIPLEARRELHAAAAAAFLATVGEQASDHSERIGHHLYEAGDRDRAASLFARAAEHHERLSQPEPMIRLLTRALDLADHEQRAASEITGWLRAIAVAVSSVRAAPDLQSTTSLALRRVDAAGTLAERVGARLDTARALASINVFDDAYARIEEAFALAGDDARLRADALSVEVESASRSGNFARAMRAIEKLDAIGGIRDARALLTASYVRAAAGDVASALRAIDDAESLEGEDDLLAAVDRERRRVLVYIYARDFARAVAVSERAVDLARSAGVRFAIAAALHNLGDASRRLGDLPRAYAALAESRDICEAAGQERLATLNRIHLAFLDGLRGVEGAAALLREFVRYADSRGYVTDALEGRFLLGALLQRSGADADAKRELEHVLAKALEYGNRLIADDAREALAAVAEAAYQTTPDDG